MTDTDRRTLLEQENLQRSEPLNAASTKLTPPAVVPSSYRREAMQPLTGSTATCGHGCGRSPLMKTTPCNSGTKVRVRPTPKRLMGLAAAFQQHHQQTQQCGYDQRSTVSGPISGGSSGSPTKRQRRYQQAASVGATSRSGSTCGKVYAMRQKLIQKHYDTKCRVGGIGGGVSIWPAMDDMRLSRHDAAKVFLSCSLLVISTALLFVFLHGNCVYKLRKFSSELSLFHSSHPLQTPLGELHVEKGEGRILVQEDSSFSERVLQWHRDFLSLQRSIDVEYNTKLSEWAIFDVVSLSLYIVGVVGLFYFLFENMFSRNRLTPRRIKIWLSLLSVVLTLTVLLAYLLACAQGLETASQDAVYTLNNQLEWLLTSNNDLTLFLNVLSYWKTRCLPPTSRGLLTVVGLVRVQDLTHYLVFYSVPIATAICTPIVKVVFSLWTIYSCPKSSR